MNFAISGNLSIEKTVIDSECAIRQVSRKKDSNSGTTDTVTPDAVRSSIIKNLNQSKPIRKNLRSDEYETLQGLAADNSIRIMKADKGGQIVVVDKQDYISQASKLLNEPTYRISPTNDTLTDIKKVRTVIESSAFLTKFEKLISIPSSAVPARFYALPKVHKVNTPYRPIVAGIGTAVHSLASMLAKKLSHLSDRNVHTVKNSQYFVKKIRDIPCSENTILVSFDVTSLFTKVPLQGALDALSRRLREVYSEDETISDILALVTTCTSNTQFLFQGELYEQTAGLAMGNPLSPLLADTYLHYFEEDMLKSKPNALEEWLRYVDDVFGLWTGTKEDLLDFVKYLNSLNPNIQFTVEIGSDSLPFLDVLVIKSDNHFESKVYRKPFSVSLPLHRRSCHPWSQKMTTFHSYVHRALCVCSNETFLQEELSFLKQVAMDRGYSPSIVDQAAEKLKLRMDNASRFVSSLSPAHEKKQVKHASMTYFPKTSSIIASDLKKINIQASFTPARTIYKILPSTKDPIPDADKWGIYQLRCECGKGYIGQTIRTLAIRSREHYNHTINNRADKSAVAKHCIETGHAFDFRNPKLLFQPKYRSQLDVCETVFIRRHQKELVNSNLMPWLHDNWNKILH